MFHLEKVNKLYYSLPSIYLKWTKGILVTRKQFSLRAIYFCLNKYFFYKLIEIPLVKDNGNIIMILMSFYKVYNDV